MWLQHPLWPAINSGHYVLLVIYSGHYVLPTINSVHYVCPQLIVAAMFCLQQQQQHRVSWVGWGDRVGCGGGWMVQTMMQTLQLKLSQVEIEFGCANFTTIYGVKTLVWFISILLESFGQNLAAKQQYSVVIYHIFQKFLMSYIFHYQSLSYLTLNICSRQYKYQIKM